MEYKADEYLNYGASYPIEETRRELSEIAGIDMIDLKGEEQENG